MQKIFFTAILMVAFSCNRIKVPDDVLPPEKMEDVMWDFIRADELANMAAEKDTSVKRTQKQYELYQKVLQVHNITKKDFQKSLQFYESRPDILKVVLDSLQKKSYKPEAQ